MRSRLFLLSLAAASGVLLASGEPFRCGDLWYDYIEDEAGCCIVVAAPDGAVYQGDVALPEFVDSDTQSGLRVCGVADYAFQGSGITSFTGSKGLLRIGDYAFYGCNELLSVTVGSAVESLGARCLAYCPSLESADLMSEISELPDQLFYGDSSLADVNLPSSLTSIGEGAFRYCSSLGEIWIPEGVSEIGASAFEDCASLEEVVLPESLTTLAGTLFRYCTSLSSVKGFEGVEEIGEEAFAGCRGLTSLTFGPRLASIGMGSFQSCRSLEQIDLGSSLPEIGKLSFSHCDALGFVSIGGNVSSVGEMAFSNCETLSLLEINRPVREIGAKAFSGCPDLKVVYVDNPVPPIMSRTAFDDATYDGDLCVGMGLRTLYRTSPGWENFRYVTEVTDFPTHSGVEEIAADGSDDSAYIIEGACLHAKSLIRECTVSDVAGQVVYRGSLEEGCSLRLPQGFLIVTADGATSKIIVR